MRWIEMIFDGNIIPISVPGGRVIDAENRSPLFLITLYCAPIPINPGKSAIR